MKNNLLFVAIFFIAKIFAQDSGVGSVVEYNKALNGEFEVYNLPKRLNKVDKQLSIDYSSIEGLLQSYLSASDMGWAKSEYLNPETKIIRDTEHFTSVKNSSVDDYIQLENVYKFKYNSREMAFVRYSFIFEKLPFPFVSMLSVEKSNNRWYINNILNQSDMYTILKDFDNNFLIDCLINKKSNNQRVDGLIQNSLDTNFNLVLPKLYKTLQKLKTDDKSFYDSIRDERMIKEEAVFRNGVETSTPNKYSFNNVYQSFVYDNVNFKEYQKKYSNIVSDENNLKEFANKPEALLLSETPINLVVKIEVEEGNNKSYFVVYVKNNIKEIAQIQGSNEAYTIIENNANDNFLAILKIVKSEFLIQVFNKEVEDKIASAIYTKQTDNLNIDLLHDYIMNNKASLSKYLE